MLARRFRVEDVLVDDERRSARFCRVSAGKSAFLREKCRFFRVKRDEGTPELSKSGMCPGGVERLAFSAEI